jgi:hypothetical protein
VDAVSRVAGSGSSGGFVLSCFGGCRAGPEPEAVVAGFEDVAMMGGAIEERGGNLGIAGLTHILAIPA